MHFLQCLDASHELEGVKTRVVSTNVTFQGTLLNQDTRAMVQQLKVGITRSAVDGALVLEYEDMVTGKCSKLSRSQCLCLGRIEIPKVRRFLSVLAPQIGPIGEFEGEPVLWTSRPSIGLLRTSTSGHAVVELTSSRIDSPPWRVSNRNSWHNNDGTNVIDSRAEGISVNDLKHVGSRTFFLESTEVLMYILTISEGTLQSESNHFCCHKARSRVNNDRFEDLVSAGDLASMGSLEIIMDRREVVEERCQSGADRRSTLPAKTGGLRGPGATDHSQASRRARPPPVHQHRHPFGTRPLDANVVHLRIRPRRGT